MDRRVTTPTWGPPPPCKQDLNIPLQNNSGNRDNKTYVLCPTLQTRTCIGVLKSTIMFFHSFIALEYAFKCFFFLLLIARLKAIILPAEVSWKTH